MPKAKKITKAAKAAPVAAPVTAVAVAKPAKAAPAKVAAEPSGTVLKVAFKDLNAEGLKTLRRHLRQALRSVGPYKDQKPQFRFHKIGTRWIFPTSRDVAVAREIRKGIAALNE